MLKALQNGQPVKDVCARFDVGISWVYKIYRRYKTTGSYKALPRPGAPRKLSDDDIKRLEKLVADNPSATLQELKQLGGFSVGLTTIHKVLRKQLKITYKKNAFCSRTKSRRCKAGT